MGNKQKIRWVPSTEARAVSSARLPVRPVARESTRTAPARVEPPSSVSPSLPSEDSPEEVVSRESPPPSTRRPEVSSRPSSRTSSVTPSPTLSTPRERPSPPSTSSMLSRDRAEPSTVSADEHFECYIHCARYRFGGL